MTNEQRTKISGALCEERNDYARECLKRIEKEYGKIEGADYMLNRFFDILSAEVEIPTTLCEDEEAVDTEEERLSDAGTD